MKRKQNHPKVFHLSKSKHYPLTIAHRAWVTSYALVDNEKVFAVSLFLSNHVTQLLGYLNRLHGKRYPRDIFHNQMSGSFIT